MSDLDIIAQLVEKIHQLPTHVVVELDSFITLLLREYKTVNDASQQIDLLAELHRATKRKLVNEIERKIGRNLIKFQIIEQVLKSLAGCVNISITVNDGKIETDFEKHIEHINKQTMGKVANQVLENISPSAEELVISEYEELKSVRVNFRQFFKEPDKRKEELKSIVTERNDFVHHLFSKWNLNSLENTLQLEQYLDQQHKKICSELEYLLSQIKFIKKFSTNADVERHVELAFLILELFEMSKLEGDWIVLDKALHAIRQKAPQDIINLKERFGKKLREMMLPEDIFEVKNELTNKGGKRILYRIKPHLKCVEFGRCRIVLTQIENCPTVVDLWVY